MKKFDKARTKKLVSHAERDCWRDFESFMIKKTGFEPTAEQKKYFLAGVMSGFDYGMATMLEEIKKDLRGGLAI